MNPTITKMLISLQLEISNLVDLFLLEEVEEHFDPPHQHSLLLRATLGRLFRVILQLEP